MVSALIFLAGCQTATNSGDGVGYKSLSPNAETSKFILRSDVPFARQIAAHNRQCGKDPGCR